MEPYYICLHFSNLDIASKWVWPFILYYNAVPPPSPTQVCAHAQAAGWAGTVV